ncbi:hypothetical protein QQ045_026623 [Rhodiola kirilowii]
MDYFSIDKLLIPSPQFVPLQFRSPTIQAEEIVQCLLHDTASQHQFQDTTPDSASQVFFKKSFSKEANEFVDMMLLNFSPKSSSANKGANLIGNFRFDENTADDDLITTISPRNKNKFDLFNEVEIARNLTLIKSDDPHQLAKNDVNWIGEGIIGDDYAIDEDGGLNFWKLGFGGIGALSGSLLLPFVFSCSVINTRPRRITSSCGNASICRLTPSFNSKTLAYELWWCNPIYGSHSSLKRAMWDNLSSAYT